MPDDHLTDNVIAVDPEHLFESEGEGTRLPDAGDRWLSDARARTWKYIADALPGRLDDLARSIEAHADLTGVDHLGQIATRTQAMQAWEDQMAAQRAAAGPERTRQVERWAHRVLRRSQQFHAQQPRRASPADFARALCTAVRRIEEHQRAGTAPPAPADLVADVADPAILGPAPEGRPTGRKFGIIVIPDTDDDPADDTDDRAAGEAPRTRPVTPAPLAAATRQAATDQVLTLITSIVEQIDRLLALAGLLDPRPDNGRPAQGGFGGVDPETVLAIAVEVQRLRTAEHGRRHEDVRRALAAIPPPDPIKD